MNFMILCLFFNAIFFSPHLLPKLFRFLIQCFGDKKIYTRYHGSHACLVKINVTEEDDKWPFWPL